MQSSTPGLNEPKVTVVLVTYNHEAYISEAVESVLMQETDFPYEVVIAEDCSTDGTRGIVEGYRDRYPEIIRLVLAESNQNDNRAWGQAIIQARGQYVALLDGDDYWTSPQKLQKQSDFLDENSDYAICFHNVKIVGDENHLLKYYNSSSQKATTTIKDLWHRNFLATCSVVLRKGLVTELPDWFYEMRYGDWPLNIIYSQHGRIGYLCEVMGVYRLHDGGVFSSLSFSRQLEDVISFYEDMSTIYNTKYRRLIADAKIRHGRLLAWAYYDEDNLYAFQKTLIRLFAWTPLYCLKRFYRVLPLFFYLIMSRIWKVIKSSGRRASGDPDPSCDHQ